MNDSILSALTGPPLTLADIRVAGSGLPDEIGGGASATDLWKDFVAAMKVARAKQPNQPADDPQAMTNNQTH